MKGDGFNCDADARRALDHLAETLAAASWADSRGGRDVLAALIRPFCRDNPLGNDDSEVFQSASREAFRRLIRPALARIARAPCVLIVSGPSGAGKSMLTDRLLTRHPSLFAFLRRTTTRPRRATETNQDRMHRFTDEVRFDTNETWLYCKTTPFGYRAGFLIEDLLETALSGRIWITNVMVQFCDLAGLGADMRCKVVGVSPTSQYHDVTRGRLDAERTCRERLVARDGAVDATSTSARILRVWADTERLYRLANHVIVNDSARRVEDVAEEFESAVLTLTREWVHSAEAHT